jgi:hypothetical protein
MQSIACAYTCAPYPVPSSPEIFRDSHAICASGRPEVVICSTEAGCLVAAQTHRRSASDAGADCAAAGLVSSKTSGTSGSRLILIEREKARLKRLKCSVLTAARLHVEQKGKWKVAMVTCTYAPAHDWAPNQMSDLVRHIRQYLARKGVEMRHVWVLEFTKKGRPHYHLLLWLPAGLTLPKPDKRRWWPYGMTKIEWARNAVGYIAKYASKGDSLHPPARGARMHGNGGVTGDALLEQRWWKLPGWLRDDVVPSDRVRRAAPRTGGGFVSLETGETYRSPWVVLFVRGQVFIQRREM